MKRILLSTILCLSAFSSFAQSCLLIYDVNNSNVTALSNALQSAGITVTLSSTSETGYDGTNPSPIGFSAVIHLNGLTYSTDMPVAGQNALVDYVQNRGGVFISGEWNAYEYLNGRMANMRDLILFNRSSGSTGTITYNTVVGMSGHPLLAGIPSGFSFAEGYNLGSINTFSSQPATVLMRDGGGNDAVAIRNFGNGIVVGFNHAANYSGTSCLTNANIQQLYINAIRLARKNAALNFDGSNDRVSIPHKTYQVGMSELTLEAWVYITGSSGNFRNIIIKGNYGYGMAIDWNNKVGYWSDPSYSNCPKSNNAIPMNKWTHVAVVVRQGISTTFYINGVADGSSTSAGHTTINSGSNDPLFLGYQGTGCNCNYFSGSMDEVHVWNTARSAAQIAAGMNCSLRTASNLIANYDFNNGDPGVTNTGKDTLSDISGNWNKGTLLNFALTGSTSNWATPAIGHEIEITGNAAVIVDGDVTPSTADSTDFGVVNFGTVRRYTIKNTGAATLNISSITVTGTNASEFVLSGAPTTVAPNGSAVFYITFNPTVAASTRTATITVNTNDCDESVYDFSIQGQTPSIPGASLHFNGWQNSGGGSNSNPSVFDFVQVPDNGTLDLDNNYTIEAWVYLDDNTNNTIIDKGNYRYLFQTHPNGQTGLGLYNPSMGWVYSSGTVPTATWTHVAVTFDAGAQRVNFYMNGNLMSTHTSGNAGPVASPGPDNGVITIGRQQPSSCVCNNFDGRMDELRIWTRTLCQAEIQARMNCEIPTTSSGLAANYHFNQGVAGGSNGSTSTLTDATGNGNTGTLTNFALSGSTSNWVSPGGVTSGNSCGTLVQPEINIKGNSVSIVDGDITVSLTDSTNFGGVPTGTRRRFLIENTGSAALSISSILLSGTNASDFAISGVPSSVASGSSAYFYVTFNPSAIGARNATITINSNDCDEAAYDFAIQAGRRGEGLHFDGVNDFVSIPVLNLSSSNKLTIEAWIKPTNITANTYYEIVRQDGNLDWLFSFQNNGTILSFGLNTTNGYSELDVPITASDYTDGNWHHVAAVYDGATRKIYRDGVLIGSDVKTGNITFTGTMQHIGRWPLGSEYFNGTMDEVRLWNVARSCSDLRSTMSRELVGNESGLRAYYNFNQAMANSNNSGATTLNDLTSNAFNGTLNNFALTGSTSNWVAPGSGVSGTTPDPQPEINVKGNSISILDEDVTPSLADSTSFGGVVSGTRRRFTIENTGASALSISSITVSGTHASNFTVAAVPTTVAANSSAIFYVIFNATTSGLKTATININNSDCDEAVYNFNISAELPCSFSSPLATSVATHTSAFAANTPGGWTCYCNASGELLLALKLGGTGAVIPAAGGVELKINATSATWYPHGTGFVGNYNGWAGLSRSWEVYPSVQPSSNVPVRFYVSSSDITALNTTLSANGASPITTVSEMSFYKVTNGAKPAHSAIANLTQSDVKIFSNFTTANGETPFTDSSYGSGKFHAQFSVSSFSGGGGGSGGLGLTPLPVELLSLSADGIDNRYIRVSWVTTRETNTDKFEIQRSEDGRNFTGIGMVNAAGMSETGKSYQFNDFKAVVGKLYYYRLAVRETDGSVSNTRVVTGSLSEVSSGQITFSPNPASNELSVSWPVHTESARMTITTLSGQVVMDREFGNLPPNRVNLSTLNSGLYIIRFETDDKSFSSKLMIQK